ncbi:MAG: NHLP bacteriocin export ABC transporter permease/ATPase subunit [Pseudomonadota bacterium]
MNENALTQLFDTKGLPCEARTGSPILLRGSEHVWLVHSGKVDIFLSRIRDGIVDSALFRLFRVECGEILCGLPELDATAGWALVATGVAGNRLLRLDRAELEAAGAQSALRGPLAARMDAWVEQLASPLAASAPGKYAAIEAPADSAARDLVLEQDEVHLANTATLWVQPRSGSVQWMGNAEGPTGPDVGPFPLPRQCWFQVGAAGSVRIQTGYDALSEAPYWTGLDRFHASILAQLIARAQASASFEQQRLKQKSANETDNIRQAMARLSAVIEADEEGMASPDQRRNPVLAACKIIGAVIGINFVAPVAESNPDAPPMDLVARIVEATRVRHRRVALKGEWWTEDHGHLLGFSDSGKNPVAIIRQGNAYLMHDIASGQVRDVSANVAAGLEPFAFTFYRSFGSAKVSVAAMLKLGAIGNVRDYTMVLLMGIAIGILGLVTPMATGMLFDTVIPGAERGQLAQLTLALLAGAFATSMFQITRGFAMVRAEGKMDSSVQSAVWDRLLSLPMPFFRDYSAGDLANRAMGINAIRSVLSGSTLPTLLSALFASFNLFLLFYYNLKLALLAIVLVVFAMLVSLGFGLLSVRHSRKLTALEGRISGLVFQLLGGVAKLRTTGSESRAIYNWAMLYGEQQEHQFKVSMVGNLIATFNAVYPLLTNVVIYFVVATYLTKDPSFSTGTFLAFNSAFGGFMGAMLSVTSVLNSMLRIVPVYERAKPILQAEPETSDSKVYPGKLQGAIEVSRLSFSYSADGPLILDDVSLKIEAGEFVALVGSSGSGKSTLLRLLLGFEVPGAGAIYYDQQDMARVDLPALRRQLGVVLQNGQLLSGDIFSNIVGASATLTIDDAWDAATQADIADDIRAMPMGMHTVVSDGGGTLSGGQRQRLLIARAIVNRPRILFFDEATSALDNRAQAMVSESLDKLSATRIVIAHRLSTIVNADRIVVLDHGRLVQMGRYEELVNQPGLFADLAKRQIV